MTKSFTINAPEYQEEQKRFYAYNVANDESIINAASIRNDELTKDMLIAKSKKWLSERSK